MIKLSFYPLIILLLISTEAMLKAQDTLVLNNPSFEDIPRHSKIPQGWINCGFKDESPPDVGPTNFFKAKTQASHGQTHLIMVARDNGSWERIGNLLSNAMQAGRCYSFSIDLARSPTYLSVSRATKMGINFNVPIRLRMWGANIQGELQELLAVSKIVEHENWQQYNFHFCPLENHLMLVLEAMYAAGSERPYAGNIMLDNCSDLVHVPSLQRDEESQTAWDAETIPLFTSKHDVSFPKKSMISVDTVLLDQFMGDIERGRVDIGLTNLANYSKDFAELPWVIVINEETQQLNKARISMLRQRIRKMRLDAYLSVKPEQRLPKRFQYLVTGLGWGG